MVSRNDKITVEKQAKGSDDYSEDYHSKAEEDAYATNQFEDEQEPESVQQNAPGEETEYAKQQSDKQISDLKSSQQQS